MTIFTRVFNEEELKSQIVEGILLGELQPGDRLPTESEISELTGLGKTAVHSVIRQLGNCGLLRIVPRHATYVEDYKSNLSIDGFGLLISFGREHFESNRALIIDAAMVEHGVELELVRIMSKLEDADISACAALVEDGIQRFNNGDYDYMSYVEQFTKELLALGQASGNYAFTAFFRTFIDATSLVTELWIQELGIEQYLESRRNLYKLIAAHKEDEAVKLLRSSRESFFRS